MMSPESETESGFETVLRQFRQESEDRERVRDTNLQ
jgi:hypothetical protein